MATSDKTRAVHDSELQVIDAASVSEYWKKSNMPRRRAAKVAKADTGSELSPEAITHANGPVAEPDLPSPIKTESPPRTPKRKRVESSTTQSEKNARNRGQAGSHVDLNALAKTSNTEGKATTRRVKTDISNRPEVGDGRRINDRPTTKRQATRKREGAPVIKPEEELETTPGKDSKQSKVKKELGEDVVQEATAADTSKKVKRRRKTKEEKESEAMPLAARTSGLQMFVGAHVSGAKGVQNSVTNCVHIGGNAFALFLKSQRKWENPPLQDEHRDLFTAVCKEHTYDAMRHILPHGSYLVNLAQEDHDKAQQAYSTFLDDLKRCEALGIRLYNFHPGNTGPAPRSEAIARIADALNRAHKETKTVKPVLENMATVGNAIGGTFQDLHDIIDLVDDKTRVGVCLDTCHAFAAGYDLRTPEAFRNTMDEFDSVIGMKYLSALHLNDSMAPFKSYRDRHQNIGLGFLGLRAFHNVMNERRFQGMPLVLETPIDRKNEEGKDVEDKSIWANEIKLLESLIGMDTEGEEFMRLERELAQKGADAREKFQEAFEKKQAKDRVKLEKGQGKLKFKKVKKSDVKSESDSSTENEDES